MNIVDEISALISVVFVVAAILFYLIGYRAGKIDTEYKYKYSDKKKRSFDGEIYASNARYSSAMFEDDLGVRFFIRFPFTSDVGDKARVTFEIVED